jgi:surfeit locus 1 family protein
VSTAKPRSNRAVIITTAVCVALLLALGTWQVFRLQWKQQLIEAREQSLTANPVTMADIEAGIEHGYDVDFLKVRMTGEYRHDATRYVYRPRGQRAGVQVITPFIDRTGFVVLADRGFIDEARLGSAEGLRLPEGEITITGITRNRAGDRNLFSPDADRARNVWYWYDLPAIAASLPEDVSAEVDGQPPITASVFVQVEPGAEPGEEKSPEPEDLKVELPNNHLQYALTWYSLALVLMVMSWLFIRRRRRESGAGGSRA